MKFLESTEISNSCGFIPSCTTLPSKKKKAFRNAFENFEFKKNPGSTYKTYNESAFIIWSHPYLNVLCFYLLMWAKTIQNWFSSLNTKMSILSFTVFVTVQLEQTATSTSPPFHSIFTLLLEILGAVLFRRLSKAPISSPHCSHHANI